MRTTKGVLINDVSNPSINICVKSGTIKEPKVPIKVKNIPPKNKGFLIFVCLINPINFLNEAFSSTLSNLSPLRIL